MNWLFPWLLFLHVLGAIIAFGPVYSLPILGVRARRSPQHANFAAATSLAISRGVIIPVALSMAVTGGGMILVAGIDLTTERWLGVAIILYAVALAYSVFVQVPAARRMVELTATPPPPGSTGPPPELLATAARLQRGSAFLIAAVTAIAALMVLKPSF